MGVFQQFQSMVQPHVDPLVASAFDWARGTMEHSVGHKRTEEIVDAAFRPYQFVENQMETVVDGVGADAQWVGTQVAQVVDRLNTPALSPRCYEYPVETSSPRMGGSVSVNFYGGNASYYPVFYQCNPMLFFSAVSSCWQMGINPFLNPYMLMQMLMMLMMQQNMMFMIPFSFLGPQSFGIGIFLSLNPGLRFL